MELGRAGPLNAQFTTGVRHVSADGKRLALGDGPPPIGSTVHGNIGADRSRFVRRNHRANASQRQRAISHFAAGGLEGNHPRDALRVAAQVECPAGHGKGAAGGKVADAAAKEQRAGADRRPTGVRVGGPKGQRASPQLCQTTTAAEDAGVGRTGIVAAERQRDVFTGGVGQRQILPPSSPPIVAEVNVPKLSVPP